METLYQIFLRLVLVLAGAVIAAAQPTCSAGQVDDITDKSARLSVNATGDIRKVIIETSGGVVLTGGGGELATSPAGRVYRHVTGLAPNTAYTLTIRASDLGENFCVGVAVSFTTLAAQPTTITAPTPVSPDPRTRPAVTGTTRTATTCAEWASMFALSQAGDKLVLPAGIACKSTDFAGSQMAFGKGEGFRGWFSVSAIDLGTNTFTKTAHGLANGTVIRWMGREVYNTTPQPLRPWVDYFVVGATTNTFQVSLTNGGAAVDIISSPGNPAEAMYQTGARPAGEILVTTSAEASLPPIGMRVVEADRGNMPTFEAMDGTAGLPMIYLTGGTRVRFRGVRFTCGIAASNGDPDPNSCSFFMQTNPAMDGLTLEQCIFELPAPYPQRMRFTTLLLNGTNIAVVDSLFKNLAQWRSWNKSVVATNTSTTWTLSAGDNYLGHKKCTTPQAVLTITGGVATGAAHATQADNCAITFLLPVGMTGTCSNCTLTTGTTGSRPPLNGGGTGLASWWLSNATLSGGAITGVGTIQDHIYQTTESGAVIASNIGPGPVLVENNGFINCPGTTVIATGEHFDNPFYTACNSTTCGAHENGDWVIRRNLWDATEIFRPAATFPDNGQRHSHRNAFEFKDCRRCLIEGNTILSHYSYTNQGPAFVLTPLTVGETWNHPSRVTVRDVVVRHNYAHSASGISLTGGYPGGPRFLGHLSDRIQITGNVFDLDFAGLRAPGSGAGGIGALYVAQGAQGVEFSRNTVARVAGNGGTWLQTECLKSGITVAGNALAVNNTASYGGALYQTCTTPLLPTPLNAQRTAGAVWTDGGTVGTSAGNVFLASLADEAGAELDGTAATTLAARYPGGHGTWVAGSTITARRTAAGLLPTTWEHMATSPYRGVGADYAANIAARGVIFGAWSAGETDTTATIAVAAPDVWQCYARPAGGAWTRAAGTTARQSITLTGLTAKTAYDVEVGCAAERRTIKVRTR